MAGHQTFVELLLYRKDCGQALEWVPDKRARLPIREGFPTQSKGNLDFQAWRDRRYCTGVAVIEVQILPKDHFCYLANSG